MVPYSCPIFDSVLKARPLGTLTPTVIEDGAVSSSFYTPQVSLIADGALVDDDVN